MKRITNPREKLFFALGVAAYHIFTKWLNVPCIIRALLGFPCMGCGMSRAVTAVLRLDFGAALSYHPLVFTLPLPVLYFLFDGHLFGKIPDRAVLSVLAVSYVTVWILRLCGFFPLI